jgi:fibronectin-binding autotransporter adhesin
MASRLVSTVMQQMRHSCLIAGVLISLALGVQPSYAQYTANFQTNIISGVTSNWPGTYFVGLTNLSDVLVVQSGGVLSNGTGSLGYFSNSVNNSVLVTDPGSIWSNLDDIYISGGAGNSLVISNGGRVVSGPAGQGNDFVGSDTSSSNNSVVVTGAGSSWNETINYLVFGYNGGGNTLLINHGGQIVASRTIVGDEPGSTNNSILVTDSGSVWSNSGTLTVGYSSAGNSLVISNGGQVVDVGGAIGGVNETGGSGNSVLVSGSGSVWNNSGTLVVGGGKGAGNSLVVSNGGEVTSAYGYLASASNSVLVSGGGSVWSNRNDLYLGQAGPGNSLVISDSGQVIDSTAYLGYSSGVSGSSNSVTLVTESVVRSAWRNNILYVGYLGSANSLMIANGLVTATNVVIGVASPTCDNVVELDSGSLIVTNNGTGVLEVRHGELILNGGVLQADTLVITNTCAQFVHTGGTLIVSNVVLDPNTFRIVSVARQSNDMLITWMMGPGATNALQATAGDGRGGYSTNGFTDIFVVTNNTTVGTVTNYLDVGAATNYSSRYYRARLVP